MSNINNQYIKDNFVKNIDSIFNKIKAKQVLTSEEIALAQQEVRNYYAYLSQHGVEYGNIALDVLDKRTPFGQTANIHLETAAKNNGHDVASIKRIMQEYPIYLAYRDAKMRLANDFMQNQEASNIANYHYDGLRKLYDLPKEAWGGALFQEFGGSGSWMRIGSLEMKNNEVLLQNIVTALTNDEVRNGVSARQAVSYLWQTQLAAYKAMPALQDIPLKFGGLPSADLFEAHALNNLLFTNQATQSFWLWLLAEVRQLMGDKLFNDIAQPQNGAKKSAQQSTDTFVDLLKRAVADVEKTTEPAEEPSFAEYLNLARGGKVNAEMQKYLGNVFDRGLAVGETIQKSGVLNDIFKNEPLVRDGKASPEMQKYLGDVFERGVAMGEAMQKSGLLHNIFNNELPCCTDSLTILHIPCTVCDHDEL